MTLRILVVDDDFRVARLHADVVGAQPGMQVAQVVANVRDALRAVTDRAADPAGRIDLALVDLYLPDGSGLDLVRRLDCDVLVLSAAAESGTVRAALRAGAVGYLVKPFAQEALIERLTAWARYRAVLTRADTLTQSELDLAVRALHTRSQHRPKGHSTLTEQTVTQAVLEADRALSAAEVAEQVGVSRATAQRYLAELSESGRIRMQLRYGATGRPEHRYSRPA
ncbi:response regulator [Nakamurella flavida]|uniref:Transcriptional regulatory protein n=1 Tax=Nakamurella flavida TaxID=363630 RepID=A0A938YHP7_9ACTN|nr:response regulator [Nakamurella flavida]MBM9477890.1 response regulator [Nakamurella flavida]MDP9778396.1 response regulator of citrate/malate metabolism [Nakamurella flavida]